ncbi:MAG: drug/metabolite-transporting permease [Flavobacterium sp.]|uniref:EamA family transporter n=1 Tax=Flavobacterium profundi TaxID=1774945 RepID=A0A6I4ILI7_9FLAO|nr:MULTISPECIES: EamA family transporter [Flavobacterium]MBF04258.1 drug/metabolite-transporting permease [Flavobacterium sp.]MVO09549.1 EamA family transporter [Flavobacterium profundi]
MAYFSVFHEYIKQKKKAIGLPFLALCWISFFWGTTWIASKEGVKHMPAMQLVVLRQFFGGIIYLTYFLIKKAPWPTQRQWRNILVLSILNFMLSNGLSTWGVKYISSGLGAIIGSIFPLWIVIISFFRGEKVSWKAVLGLIICFFGICVIFYDYLNDFLNPEFRFGIILSVIATFTWALSSIYIRENRTNFNPYFSLGLQMLISCVAIFGVIQSTGETVPLSEIPAVSWWSIAYLVVFGSVLTFIAFIYALEHLPKEVSSLYAYINPMVALFFGYILFNEPLTVSIAIGGLVTLTGLFLVNKAIKKP